MFFLLKKSFSEFYFLNKQKKKVFHFKFTEEEKNMGKRKEEGRERRKYNYNKEDNKDMTVMCVRGTNIK